MVLPLTSYSPSHGAREGETTRITGRASDADVSKQGRGVHVPEPHACTLTPKRRVAHVARPCAAAAPAAQRKLLFSLSAFFLREGKKNGKK